MADLNNEDFGMDALNEYVCGAMLMNRSNIRFRWDDGSDAGDAEADPAPVVLNTDLGAESEGGYATAYTLARNESSHSNISL